MITDKEYPATHSMATAWYMVDADGNVGLMAFEDNGPVPAFDHVVADLGLSDLIFGQGFSPSDYRVGIHLNVTQIHELLDEPLNPGEVESWNEVCLAIEPNQTLEFLKLCRNTDITNYGCVSPEMNLYFVEVFRCMDDNHDVIVGSSLDRMIKANMITAVYEIPYFDTVYDEESLSACMLRSPYYIYYEPYSTSYPQYRISTPSIPVKISQVDETFREKLIHIPIRFKDMENLQIAEWCVCRSNENDLVIGNAGYTLFAIDERTKKYCLTSPFLFDFYEYCPDMGIFKCSKCNRDCVSTIRQINSLKPTILYVVAPIRKECIDLNQRELLKEYKEKIAVFSYIPKFPYKKYRCWMMINDVKDQMTVENLTSVLAASKAWFDRMIASINPQVIIIDDDALSVFTAVYPIANNEVLINNSRYPIFEESSIKENEEYIRSLAIAPYRGEVFKMTYTVKEVDELKRDGKVYGFDY